ncbi:MAG: phage head closure protein [Rickettsiales bacterium]|jgi:SPP1 family predicted phage head-tail adaptor|nr:phage head closure protein [Rickettsiales bacterium]
MSSFTSCLRQIIVIQEPIFKDDGLGGREESWTYFETLNAEAKALYNHKSGESFSSMQLMDNSLYRFRIRYNPKITRDMRIIYSEKTFKIKRIINEDEKNAVTVIIGQEVI